MRDDEQERHRCEVRYICAIGDRARAYLSEVSKHRGKASADKLREDARQQYTKGNRGAAGDWRE
jgi:hypothetical protein